MRLVLPVGIPPKSEMICKDEPPRISSEKRRRRLVIAFLCQVTRQGHDRVQFIS
jgi:hypothetical protein